MGCLQSATDMPRRKGAHLAKECFEKELQAIRAA